jgi:hypothetical protein
MDGHFLIEFVGEIRYPILKTLTARVAVTVHDEAAVARFGLSQDDALRKFTVYEQLPFTDAIPKEGNTRPKGPAPYEKSHHILA